MSDKESPIKEGIDVEKIHKTASEYFEHLARNIRKSIEKAGLKGENPKDDANRLVRTIMSFGILSSMKIEPDVMATALWGVPKPVLTMAKKRLLAMGERRTKILDLILEAIRLKLGRNNYY